MGTSSHLGKGAVTVMCVLIVVAVKVMCMHNGRRCDGYSYSHRYSDHDRAAASVEGNDGPRVVLRVMMGRS